MRSNNNRKGPGPESLLSFFLSPKGLSRLEGCLVSDGGDVRVPVLGTCRWRGVTGAVD